MEKKGLVISFLIFGIIFIILAIYLLIIGFGEIFEKSNVILVSILGYLFFYFDNPGFFSSFFEIGYFMLLGLPNAPYVYVGLTLLFNGIIINTVPTIYSIAIVNRIRRDLK